MQDWCIAECILEKGLQSSMMTINIRYDDFTSVYMPLFREEVKSFDHEFYNNHSNVILNKFGLDLLDATGLEYAIFKIIDPRIWMLFKIKYGI